MTPSQRHPWLRPAAVLAHRTRRRLQWLTSGADWASYRSPHDLPVPVHRHGSPLLRELTGAQLVLQHNKVVNLRLASARVDRLVIRPGQTFSFNRVVGSCTRRKGYIDGLRLSDGIAVAGVGGGICQLANLLHWMFLHSPLTVVDRSEHSFDPFPDNGRVVPWGVGCTIAYNYVDLVVRNDTASTFQLRTWVGDTHLHGELRGDRELPVSYSVEARHEQFDLGEDGQVCRSNEIWRTTTDRGTGAVGEELVKRNRAVVRYPVDAQAITRPRSTTADGRNSTERSSSGLAS
jgi:vancomycin resistance protein VanW